MKIMIVQEEIAAGLEIMDLVGVIQARWEKAAAAAATGNNFFKSI